MDSAQQVALPDYGTCLLQVGADGTQSGWFSDDGAALAQVVNPFAIDWRTSDYLPGDVLVLGIWSKLATFAVKYHLADGLHVQLMYVANYGHTFTAVVCVRMAGCCNRTGFSVGCLFPHRYGCGTYDCMQHKRADQAIM